MSPEKTPDTLTNDQAEELARRGAAQIDHDTLQVGLASPETGNNLNAINNPAERMVEDDKNRFDALEAAKSGDLSGIEDETEKQALRTRFEQEGQKGLESMVEALQKKVTTETIDTEKLAGYVAEQHLGTDAQGTTKMEMGKVAAKMGIDSALGSAESQES